jgi:phospholipid/cholesterol/gamma-HCH transport system substrate-binding protein
MANEARIFRVGVFLLVGIILLVTVVILFFAGRYFSDTKRYCTYFIESVQGLDRNAPVKFSGWSVGRVNAIRIAPDGKLIEVVMDINRSFKVQRTNHIARMQTVNISGMRYIEISLRDNRERREPPLTFKAPYPVIPSYPAPQMFDILETLNSQIKSIDTRDISAGMVAALAQINAFFDTNTWQPIFTQLRSTVATADRVGRELDGHLTAGGLSNLIVDATATVKRLRAIADHVDPAEVDRLLRQAASLTAQLNDTIYAMQNNLQPILQDLQRTIDNLRSFTEALKTRPSQTLLGKPVEQEQ